MLNAKRHCAAVFLFAAVLFCSKITSAENYVAFEGEKTSWHGFDRYDFAMDDASFEITPSKAPAKGQRRCIVVVPKTPAPGNPWSWRGCYWDHEPQTEVELLRRGFHICYIGADANNRPDKHWDAWYAYLTEKHGLSKKPAFIGMSRGGEFSYTWATQNPDKVTCIYADNSGGNREMMMKLGDLAKNDVPILHVCGSIDPILGKFSLPIEAIYQQFNGRISTMIKDGFGHHPHSLRDPTPIADFIEHSFQEAANKDTIAHPDFTGDRFTKSPYYSSESFYRDYREKDGAWIICRGPLFVDCYTRYEFDLPGVKGTIRILAPKTAAAGVPWVYRADFVARDSVVDFALLAKGFHIVTGPVSYDTNNLSLEHWNAVYKHLTDHGFSKKPVMAGTGGAAGEAYGWALENPDKVSCIFAENPILKSTLLKNNPFDFAPLAKAGVPILHDCGSLDPFFNEFTLNAEKKYKELGGKMTVMVKAGAGHFPSAPKDLNAVLEFIVGNAK
ncbi:MAG TPA: alpha/beta hydrolase [Planctomycetota bacterium]|nr:alpha/beta hydrolase [Planctomycetota bacterium]